MFLNHDQQRDVLQIQMHWCFLLDQNGRPIAVLPHKRLPSSEEIRGMAFDKFEKMGFRVERCNPAQANAIVRVYNNLCYEHNKNQYCLLGAMCFVKADEDSEWISAKGDEIDYTKCIVIHDFFDGGEVEVNMDYSDTYVKLI